MTLDKDSVTTDIVLFNTEKLPEKEWEIFVEDVKKKNPNIPVTSWFTTLTEEDKEYLFESGEIKYDFR